MSCDDRNKFVTPVVLLTTANMRADRDQELVRLVHSVERFHQNHPMVPLHHVMLLQECNDPVAAAMALGFPERMDVFASDKQLPLSKARNIMINRLFAAPPFDLAEAMVAFPDDDAWYPEQSLDHIHACFTKDAELDLWFCRYSSDAHFPASMAQKAPSLQEVISRASSNTVAIRGSVLDKVRGFDENLGLGTSAKSGEDTDFAIRSFLVARRAQFAPFHMIGHRDFDPAIRAKYYGGTLVALGRHKKVGFAAATAFARKVLVGLALFARRELSATQLVQAWKMYGTNLPAINPAWSGPDATQSQKLG